MGLNRDFQQKIYHASPMYDVGKIGIPDQILLKNTPLMPKEWEVMKTHTTLGAQLLSEGKSDYLRMGADIAHFHHEHWDGTGYPTGLAGDAIPLSARIMAVCDTYDALRSERPYKLGCSHKRTMEILSRGDGKTSPEHFDPAVLSVFLRHGNVFCDIYESHTEKAGSVLSA